MANIGNVELKIIFKKRWLYYPIQWKVKIKAFFGVTDFVYNEAETHKLFNKLVRTYAIINGKKTRIIL